MKQVSFKILSIISVILFFNSCSSCRHTQLIGNLSPYDYGLRNAKTGKERYDALYRVHQAALNEGKRVDYSGIKRIDLDIPANAKSIPLNVDNDFGGVVFNVTNNAKDLSLFTYQAHPKKIVINKSDIDRGIFLEYPELARGNHLLIISDQYQWVEKRKNHDYGHVRKDIILIQDGRAQNSVIMPYNNHYSDPICVYYEIPPSGLTIQGLTLNRSSSCTKKTYLCSITGADNVLLRNIIINTPESTLTGDNAIKITNCSNVMLEDVSVNGTYSRKDYWGYGVSLDNIWNTRINRLNGDGNWGVFGNNNLNVVSVSNSDINRFDIHCYGRDVSFDNTIFRGLYNQFSSLYGTLDFSNCKFLDFTPILFESSYSAYTPFKIVLKDCSWVISRKEKSYFISAGTGLANENARPELQNVYWPDIKIDNLDISINCDTDEVFLYYLAGNERSPINGAEDIVLRNVSVHSMVNNNIVFRFSNKKVEGPIIRKMRVSKSSFKEILQ